MKKIAIVLAFLLFPVISQAASVRGHWKDTNHDGVKDTTSSRMSGQTRTAPGWTTTATPETITQIA